MARWRSVRTSEPARRNGCPKAARLVDALCVRIIVCKSALEYHRRRVLMYVLDVLRKPSVAVAHFDA